MTGADYAEGGLQYLGDSTWECRRCEEVVEIDEGQEPLEHLGDCNE